MSARYILVADASRARLFRQPIHSHELQLVGDFEHPESRARSRELMADANGRKAAGPSVGGNYGGRAVSLGVGRPGVAPDTEPKEVEAEKFARAMAETIEANVRDPDDKLVLAAPPHFLGLLKGTLSATLTKRIEHAIDKDFSKMDDRELRSRLEAELGPR